MQLKTYPFVRKCKFLKTRPIVQYTHHTPLNSSISRKIYEGRTWRWKNVVTHLRSVPGSNRESNNPWKVTTVTRNLIHQHTQCLYMLTKTAIFLTHPHLAKAFPHSHTHWRRGPKWNGEKRKINGYSKKTKTNLILYKNKNVTKSHPMINGEFLRYIFSRLCEKRQFHLSTSLRAPQISARPWSAFWLPPPLPRCYTWVTRKRAKKSVVATHASELFDLEIQGVGVMINWRITATLSPTTCDTNAHLSFFDRRECLKIRSQGFWNISLLYQEVLVSLRIQNPRKTKGELVFQILLKIGHGLHLRRI